MSDGSPDVSPDDWRAAVANFLARAEVLPPGCHCRGVTHDRRCPHYIHQPGDGLDVVRLPIESVWRILGG